QEIYPGDFLRPVVSEPLPEKMWLPDLGLRDYSEPALLLSKSGRYERVIRQKAASAARSIASDVSYALLLVPTQTQRVLEHIGRLYKNSCSFLELGPRRPFDKCQASSYRKLQAFKGDRDLHKRVETFDAYRLEVTERWSNSRRRGRYFDSRNTPS